MHIVIAGQTYDPPTNGQGVFSIHLAEGLAKRGHSVMVITPSDRSHAYCADRRGVRVERIASISFKPFFPEVHVTLAPGSHIAYLFDEFQPDIVHIQDHYPLCRTVVQLAGKQGLSLVGTNHFLPDNIIAYLPLLPKSHIFHKLLVRLIWKTVLDVFNRLDIATAPTETAARKLRQQGLEVGVRAISCGVDLDHFTPQPGLNPAEMRSRYGLRRDGTLFLYVGRVDQDKGLDVLVWAMHHLARDDVQLAIAGRGTHAGALQALAHHLDLGRRVVLTGYVPSEDLVALLNSADVFVMPSQVELQSIATLEAMGTGRPVLAADAQALPELVKNGVNGYLFRPGDAQDAARWMAQLAGPADLDAFGAASLEIVAPHNLYRTIDRYEELYRAVTQPASDLAGLPPLAPRQRVRAS
jgi:1,2-diacylglycerol 3-alpha-glucosyltransferase